MFCSILGHDVEETRLHHSPGLLNIGSAVKIEYVSVRLRLLRVLKVDHLRENLSNIHRYNSLKLKPTHQ